MSDTTSIQACLKSGISLLNNSDSPQLDCEVLLSFVLNKERTYLRAWPEKLLTHQQLSEFQSLLEHRRTGQPIAYIVEQREFWSHNFNVTPDVLIPRPDTELLVEVTLSLYQQHEPIHIADLGTGSGAIAISLGLEFPNATITAIDNSAAAIKVANGNAIKLGANNVTFTNSHWLEATQHQPFHLIVSNPPYIDKNDTHLNEGDVRYEPKSALVSSNHGLHDIELIAQQAKQHLHNNGHLLLEHGYEQGVAVKNLLESMGYQQLQQFKDIQGHTRATLAQLNFIVDNELCTHPS